jgi:hypothetical protein
LYSLNKKSSVKKIGYDVGVHRWSIFADAGADGLLPMPIVARYFY